MLYGFFSTGLSRGASEMQGKVHDLPKRAKGWKKDVCMEVGPSYSKVFYTCIFEMQKHSFRVTGSVKMAVST